MGIQDYTSPPKLYFTPVPKIVFLKTKGHDMGFCFGFISIKMEKSTNCSFAENLFWLSKCSSENILALRRTHDNMETAVQNFPVYTLWNCNPHV